jgi:pyruvate kinase
MRGERTGTDGPLHPAGTGVVGPAADPDGDGRNAKIVCTLGPASADRDAIRGLAAAGMSVARLNASHGSVDDRRDLIETLRAVDEETTDPLAVMLDLSGPEIRTAPIDGSIRLRTGDTVAFAPGDDATPDRVGVSTSLAGVDPGDRILLDDGRIETTVEAVDGETVRARVDSGGDLGGRRGVNVPGVDLGLDPVTERDRADLALAAETMVDFVAASFVQGAADVRAVEAALGDQGADIPVVAKIERADAVANAGAIIGEAYGVMVARGDLGVECPLEEVPVIQKRLIRRCRETGTPVITATEMLDSMITERRPTRAEASDVANAVLDGTDAVMLSGETAIGDHPERVVRTMDRIVRCAEACDEYAELREQRVPAAGGTGADAIARSARFLARDVDASAVVVASESGYTALKTAKYRPSVPVIASTPRDRVRRQLALSGGVRPVYAPITEGGAHAVIENAVGAAIDTGAVESGDTVVVLSGMMTELDRDGERTANTLKIHVAAETIATGRRVVGGRVTGSLYRGAEPSGTGPTIAVVDEPSEATVEGTDGLVIVGDEPAESLLRRVRAAGRPTIRVSTIERDLDSGAVVTLDAERGVLYRGAVDAGRRDGRGADV